MKIESINQNFIGGIILMSLPFLFYVSVASEKFFQNSFLIESVFVPIDKTSGLLSAFIMIGLPMIALCINIFPNIKFKLKKEKDILKIDLEIKNNLLNILISLGAFITILTVIAYLFTENFKLK